MVRGMDSTELSLEGAVCKVCQLKMCIFWCWLFYVRSKVYETYISACRGTAKYLNIRTQLSHSRCTQLIRAYTLLTVGKLKLLICSSYAMKVLAHNRRRHTSSADIWVLS